VGEFIFAFITLTQLFLIVYLFGRRSHENKFHLDYIIAHTFLLLLIAVFYMIIQVYLKKSLYFEILNLMHIGSYIFLILHVASAIKGYRVRFRPIFFIPLLAYILTMILNYTGIYILGYNTPKSAFMGIQIDNPILYTDKLLVKLFVSLVMLAYLFNLCINSIDDTLTINKKQLYKFWIYTYIFLLFETLLVTNAYYFNILNPIFDSPINSLISLNFIVSFLFFLFNPSLIRYLPVIKKIEVHVNKNINHVFPTIQTYFKNEKTYLQKKLTISSVASSIGFSQTKVQKAILLGVNLNFNDFVNSYRIQKAVELIEKGYLLKMNLQSLASETGFNSHQTFFRAFKKVKGCTPTEYWKRIE